MKLSSFVAPLLIFFGIGIVAASRGRVGPMATKVKENSDAYSLPPPEVLNYASLGYRSALAELIWAHILVTQGLRMSEHRRFDHLDLYMQAVTSLDPVFREPYRLADSLFAYQINDPDRSSSVHQARELIEKGLKVRPYDAELWLGYGQFLAYIAPGMLSDPKEADQWRLDGSKALAHAGELGGQDSSLLWKSLPSLFRLSKEGETDAAIRFLERIYGMTEDEDLKPLIAAKLEQLNKGRADSRAMVLSKQFDSLWRKQAPFVSRGGFMVLGPSVSPWTCSGSHSTDDACLRDWNAWARTVSPEPVTW
jgi:hypothetical protein